MHVATPSFPTPSEVLARNLRRIREARHLSQSELAAMLRAVGLRQWVGPTVAQVEGMTRKVSIDELFALSLLLRAPVLDLFADVSKHVQVVPDLLPFGPEVLRATSEEQMDAWWRWLDTALETGFPTRFTTFRFEAEEARLADEAAARFGTTSADVKKTAARRWSRTFREERERRLAKGDAEGDLRVRRGHVTRKLMTELEDVYARRRKRSGSRREES